MFKWIKNIFKKKEVISKPTCDIERLRRLAGITPAPYNNTKQYDWSIATEHLAAAARLKETLSNFETDEERRAYAIELGEKYNTNSSKLSVGVRNSDGSCDTMIINSDSNELMEPIKCSLNPPVDTQNDIKWVVDFDKPNKYRSHYEEHN